ncbi:MAG: hypothetical protein ABSH01_06520 [Terriglobia bacterium]|jgi:hypothetical protein
MVDIALALAQGVINLVLAWYAVHIFLEHGKKKVAFLFVLVGLPGLVLIGLSAYRVSQPQRDIATRISKISAQLQNLHAAAPQHFFVGLGEDLKSGKSTSTIKVIPDSEYQRRYKILNALRIEYILSNRDFRPTLVAGIEWPPLEWINHRLANLGETWTAAVGSNSLELEFMESQPQ